MRTGFALAILAMAGLAACGGDAETATAEGRAEAGQTDNPVSSAKLVATPAAIDLEPCALMNEAALSDLEITQVAQASRTAGVESIYNTGTKAPFVGCNWSTPGGVPSMHLRVYHAPDVAMPEYGATAVDVADGGWLAEEGGRVRLFVKSGDRLLRISPQAPKYYGAEDATYLPRIFEGVASRLGSPARNMAVADALPDPASVCGALESVPSTQIFFGDVLALPIVRRIFSDQAADAEWGEISGCLWTDAKNNRNSVSARFLNETALDYELKSSSAEWEDATIAGRSARFSRDTYLVEMGEGRTLAISSGSMPRGNDLEEAATAIVRALSQ